MLQQAQISEGRVCVVICRCCRSLLKKSGCRTPRIELEEIGPSLDLVLRRTHLASDDLYKLAHRKPKALKVKLHFLLGNGKQRLLIQSISGETVQLLPLRADFPNVLKRAPEDSFYPVETASQS